MSSLTTCVMTSSHCPIPRSRIVVENNQWYRFDLVECLNILTSNSIFNYFICQEVTCKPYLILHPLSVARWGLLDSPGKMSNFQKFYGVRPRSKFSTGEIRKRIGEIRKRIGEIRKRTGEIRKRIGEIRKRIGEIRKRIGEIRKVPGMI